MSFRIWQGDETISFETPKRETFLLCISLFCMTHLSTSWNISSLAFRHYFRLKIIMVKLLSTCRDWAPKDLLQVPIDKSPDAAQRNNRFRQIPLHVAIEGFAMSNDQKRVRFEETIKCLLESFPVGVSARDKSGKTPLILACESNIGVSMIYWLFRVDPVSNLSLGRQFRVPRDSSAESAKDRLDTKKHLLVNIHL